MDYYINESAKAEGIDPRQELERLVLSNKPFINRDQIMEDTSNPIAIEEDDWLKEFVRANSPYEVLENCFFNNDLEKIAMEQLEIAPNVDDIVSEVLYKLGFKKKVEPTGLFQYIENLEQLQGDVLKMTEVIDELLRKLFLFYSYILRQYALGETGANGAIEEVDADDDKEDPIDIIENLIQRYRGKDSKSLGDLYQWLKELMELVEKNIELANYCQRHFQRETPLNMSQIAEIGMFRTYRNLIGSGHVMDSTSWEMHKNRAEINLGDMDDSTRREWEGSWRNVLRERELRQNLPREQMLQRMAGFFKKFLDSLSENRIYPKIIVLRSYEVDEYGTVKIYANSSDPNEDVILTDYNFSDFNAGTFTEFYYHSRTNPTGIEPILVPKEELKNWATKLNKDTENQEKA